MHLDGQEIRDGLLLIRSARDGNRRLISLCGEIDLANAHVAETALREAVEEEPEQIVVDMRELSFIDSTGIACLVSFLRDDEKSDRLRFIHSPFSAVARVLQVTGVDTKLREAPAGSLDGMGEGAPLPASDPGRDGPGQS